MKGTFTFTDGASNQTNLTNTYNSEARGNKFLFAKDLFRKVKQLFIQGEIIEPLINTIFEKPIKDVQLQTMACGNAPVEAAIPCG